MTRIVVVGATSRMAQEVLKCFAANGAELFIVGRDAAKLNAVSADLLIRGAHKVGTCTLDVNEIRRHPQVLQEAMGCLGGCDIMLVAHGTLPDQTRCQKDVDVTLLELKTNFLSTVSLLTIFANYFEERGSGCMAVITSVAGDRGRQSNYVYGAGKAALTVFLQGLRNRLWKAGVTVITIKPGLVATPMTAHLSKNFLCADPGMVGRRIFKAIVKRQDVIYVPWFWRWIMTAITLVPESIFKRLRL